MKYAFGALIAAVAILFSFQNCKKNASGEVALVDSSSISKIDLSQEKPTSAALYFNEIQTMQKPTGAYQVIARASLKIDLANGHMEKTTEVSNQAEQYCLPDAKTAELNAMLSGFQICRVQHEVNPDMMCTMEYRYPYAAIITSREQFELGMAESGCPKETIDLCDGQAEVLKAYIDNLKGNYQQMSCP